MGWAGAQEDLTQEIKNYSRALGGDPQAQNQSWLYRMQKRQGTLPQPQQSQPQSAEQSAADFEAYKKDYYKKKAEFDRQFQQPQNEELTMAVSKDQKDKDDYNRFLRAKLSAGKPMTRSEQEFLQKYQLAQQIRSKMAEGASGYIPTKKQARDPRFSTALTVDIKPGQVGKEANKMGLQTDKQGKPALLMKTANLREEQTLEQRLHNELSNFQEAKTVSELKTFHARVKLGKGGALIDTQVVARNYEMAKRLLRAQYGENSLSSNVREMQ
jgi:hypothetical protein